MSSSTTESGAPHNSGSEMHVPITGTAEMDYFSSPPSSPGVESPSAFSHAERSVSLGVFFSADDGEMNDVIAALRVSQRVVKETCEILADYRPKTEQNTNLAATLHTHEREFSEWIFSGMNIDPSRRIAIASLPLYENLAKYVSLLQDVESYLPQAPPSKVGSLLRRLSTSGPHHHASLPAHDGMTLENPRLTMMTNKILKAFDELKEAVSLFRSGEKKRKATRDIAQRTRKELKIQHDLCLPETRLDLLATINSWVKSEAEDNGRVMCLVGPEGSGKSAVAATLTVEWKKAGLLESQIFLIKMVTPPRTPRRFGDAEEEEHKPTALSRALSSFSKFKRSSSRSSRSSSMPSNSLESVLKMPISEEGKTRTVVVDGLDHAFDGEWQRIVNTLHEVLNKHKNLKLLLTARSDSPSWLEALRPAHPITVQRVPSANDPANIQDISTYVSAKLSILLSPSHQQRVVEASEGNWADVVRLVREVEELGDHERGLDTVLYREVIRRHGEGVKVILV